jgi:hypothetical protein
LLLFAVVDQFFFFFLSISCISFWLFALWPSQYTLDDYQKKKNLVSSYLLIWTLDSMKEYSI